MKVKLLSVSLLLAALSFTACGGDASKKEVVTDEKKAVMAIDSATLQIDKIGETIDSLSQSAQSALDALDK